MLNLISILSRWFPVAVCLCFASSFALAQNTPSGSDLPNPVSGTLVPGYVLAKRVTGTVRVLDEATQQLRQIKEGDRLKQGETVITAPDKSSSVVLVFSSGATVQLRPNTQLSIERFLQELWTGDYKPGSADKEPSTSQVKLDMARGEIVGKIIKLNKERGSSFSIRTPVGVAGVRGTTVGVQYVPDPQGQNQQILTVSVLEGVMSFGVTQSGAAGGEVLIPGNAQVLLRAFVPPGQPPQLPVASSIAPAPLSPGSVGFLQGGLQQIMQVIDTLSVRPPAPVPTSSSQTEGTGTGSSQAESTSDTVSDSTTAVAAPPAVASPARITGGDGQTRS